MVQYPTSIAFPYVYLFLPLIRWFSFLAVALGEGVCAFNDPQKYTINLFLDDVQSRFEIESRQPSMSESSESWN